MCHSMIHIQVAGAGAGKTYTLAELILQEHDLNITHKSIFAITYTNSAKENIIKNIIEKRGRLPDNIKIQTVHTFLLNEIIFPFSWYIIKL